MKILLRTMCGCRKVISSKMREKMLPDKIDVPLYKTVSDFMKHTKNSRTFYFHKVTPGPLGEPLAIYHEYPDTEGEGDWQDD